jgi:hypothetical protein
MVGLCEKNCDFVKFSGLRSHVSASSFVMKFLKDFVYEKGTVFTPEQAMKAQR